MRSWSTTIRFTTRSRRAAVLTMALGCAGGPVRPNGGSLPLGTWGGENAALIAADSVTHVHIGCTFGDISGRVELDHDGRFRVDGTYVLRAYPIAVGPTLPAQFSGEVVGSTLTFAVAVNDTTSGKVQVLGPVTVWYRQEPRMGPCPICRAPRTGVPLFPH